jgi:xanthine dehydrogenase YagR molybdenum-binding subunit
MNRAAPEPLQNMGRPEPRVDGRLKVTGAARFGSDFPVAKPAFAYLVTSTIAAGRIVRMDLSAAKSVPGVLDILTHENTSELKQLKFEATGGGPTTSIQDLGPDIKHDGQIIAMVIAESFEAAREASYRIETTYEAKVPASTFDSDGVKTEEITKKEKLPQSGDADAAFDAAEVKFEAEYATPTQHHNPIELFTTTCVWQDGTLTVYEPSQFIHGLRAGTAQRLGIDPANVHAVSPFVGGAFGSKAQHSPRTGLVALAA